MLQCVMWLILSLLAAAGIYVFVDKYLIIKEDYYHIDVNAKEVLFQVDEKFLSFALDVSFMRCFFHKFTDSDWKKLEELTSLLSPAYLRFGGTDADRVIFDVNATAERQFVGNTSCQDDSSKGNITITGEEWIKFNNFAEKSGVNLIVDLNVLLRKNSHWDSSNAETLIKFSEEKGFPLHFQLGNEPNSFPHVFNTSISGSQLAADFYALRKLLNSTEKYREAKLIGPDVTRPKNLESSSLKFLDEFLKKENVVDVASWHQYYLNGRNATFLDFINPGTLDVLPVQIQAVSRVVREHSPDTPIWISETSSAYGGGAPKLSNRFVASFLWLDKLGVAARSNVSVVIRQSLFKDYYALIGDTFKPTPDFWISLLYKALVGRQVLSAKMPDFESNHLRFYAHCLAPNASVPGSIVIFGMNLSNDTEAVIPSGISIVYPVYAYIFRPQFHNLKAKIVLLNGVPLVYNGTVADDIVKMRKEIDYPLVLPSFSIGFWVLQENKESACRR